MQITTKHNIGDKVFVLLKDKIQYLTIVNIFLHIGPANEDKEKPIPVREQYTLYDPDTTLNSGGTYVGSAFEEKCFDTKEQLIKSFE